VFDNLKQMRRDIATAESKRTEALWAGLSMIWGAWVANPMLDTFPAAGRIFDAFTYIPVTLLGFSNNAAEIFWGLVVGCVGLYLLLALTTRSLRRRRRAVYLMMLQWGAFSAMFGLGDLRGTGCAFFGLNAVLGFSVYLHLSRLIRIEDREKQGVTL